MRCPANIRLIILGLAFGVSASLITGSAISQDVLTPGQRANVTQATATKSAGAKTQDCDCLMPGGKYWQMLLSQELENARLTARVELEEAKLDFFRDQMTERIERKERELRDRLEAFAAREREFENAMNRQLAEFAERRERQEERMRRMEEELGHSEQARARVGELEKLLVEARQQIGQMSRERVGEARP